MKRLSAFWHRPRLANNAALRWLLFSIKGQIFIVFAATFISLAALTLLNLWNVSTVKNRLLLGERYYDLFNDILEVRRFEKNYLFYGDVASLQEGRDYLTQIDSLVSNLSEDIIRITDRRTFEEFQSVLGGYEQTLKEYETRGGPEADREIRRHGKELTDFADRFLRIKRERIRKAIVKVSILPFAFLGIFLLLTLLVIRLISLGLLRPLRVLQTTIQGVARGEYSPTNYDGLHTDEMHGLLGAFNRMALELEANQEHLLQARKIAALGTFTAGIAHELNNPLNNISLTAETYIEEYADHMDPAARELIDDILAQSERACDIVRNLLDFSRTERPAFTNIEAGEIVRGTVALVKNQIAVAGTALTLEIPDDLPPVSGDIRGLQQVFMNLLLNAVQAMPDGGAISINVSEHKPDFVRFDVRDTGAGMQPETLQHIFEPFFTTKGVGKGTGLGLAVAYSIVKRHGGRIEVKSEPGTGTTFTVLLPVAGTQNKTDTNETRTDRDADTNSYCR
jgi:signal transduction histidine kinase